MSNTRLETLPTELLIEIFSNLDFLTQRYSIDRVCSRFRSIANSSPLAAKRCPWRPLTTPDGQKTVLVHRVLADDGILHLHYRERRYHFGVMPPEFTNCFSLPFGYEPVVPSCSLVHIDLVFTDGQREYIKTTAADGKGYVCIARVLGHLTLVLLFRDYSRRKHWDPKLAAAAAKLEPVAAPAFESVKLVDVGTEEAEDGVKSCRLSVQLDKRVPQPIYPSRTYHF